MRTSLHILGVVLVCLFSMSMESCVEDDPLPSTSTTTNGVGDQYQHLVGVWSLFHTLPDIPGAAGILTLRESGWCAMSITVQEGDKLNITVSEIGDWDPSESTFDFQNGLTIIYGFEGDDIAFSYDGVLYFWEWQKEK